MVKGNNLGGLCSASASASHIRRFRPGDHALLGLAVRGQHHISYAFADVLHSFPGCGTYGTASLPSFSARMSSPLAKSLLARCLLTFFFAFLSLFITGPSFLHHTGILVNMVIFTLHVTSVTGSFLRFPSPRSFQDLLEFGIHFILYRDNQESSL